MIGCGSVTEVKSGPAFNKVAYSSLRVVMRRDAAKVKDYATRHQVPHYCTDVNELINHPEVDAIYIATPPQFHEAYAIAAMEAKKPVYIEKPMALNVEACLRVADFSKNSGIKVVIAHYRRALPLFMQVKKLLDQNTLGNVHSVNISMQKSAGGNFSLKENWRLDPKIAGGGYFYDLAPHQLDLVFYFFGKAISYEGKASNQAGLYEVEDTVTGKMFLENGVHFKGDWCFCAAKENEKDLFEIVGEYGKISFPVFGNDITIEKEGVTEVIHFDPPMHNQQNLIHQVVQYFLGQGENPCSAADAMQSMRVMQAFVYGNH